MGLSSTDCHENEESLDPNLRAVLIENSLSFEKLLFRNPRKGRWTILVAGEDETNRYVLKWSSPNSPSSARDAFRNEIEFYNTRCDSPIVLSAVRTTERMLLLPYFEGTSLRDFLSIQLGTGDFDEPPFDEIEAVLDLVYRRILDFYCKRPLSEGTGTELSQELMTRWTKLLLSGPMQKSRSQIEERISHIFWNCFAGRVAKDLTQSVSSHEESRLFLGKGLVHGDLHYNNILVSEDIREACLIDFENLESDGFWVADLAYLHTMVLALFHFSPKEQERIDTILHRKLADQEVGLDKAFGEIIRPLYTAAIQNRRFLGIVTKKQATQAWIAALKRSLGW
jgi:serine/threonine protein kinase